MVLIKRGKVDIVSVLADEDVVADEKAVKTVLDEAQGILGAQQLLEESDLNTEEGN